MYPRSADKGRKLQEAWEQQQFLREVEDIESWIGEMESQLSSDDMGRDLISVNNLIKKHAVSLYLYFCTIESNYNKLVKFIIHV